MKRILYLLLFGVLITFESNAQTSIEHVLQAVEKNNTTLSALRLRMQAMKLANKTDIFLPNPEVEFNYLFGSPSSIGNRTDISITQGFDFPTAYGHRNTISDLKNEQVTMEYEKQKRELILQASLVCNQLVYLNALVNEYLQRIETAKRLVGLFQTKFESGEANILDYNKAKLGLLDLSKKVESLQVDKNAQLAELTRLNGGIPVEFSESEFQKVIIPQDFETWYALAEENNPVLSWLKIETEVSRQNEKLNSALALPKIQAGYMSEKVVGEHFQGITVGMAVPLWENKNKLKEARANTEVADALVLDTKLTFYNRLKSLHAKAVQLQGSLADYRKELELCNNTELANKALELGEISMIEYLMELAVYYESFNNMLDIQKQLHYTLAELNKYE